MKSHHWLMLGLVAVIVVLVVPIPGWGGLTLWNHFGQGIPVAKNVPASGKVNVIPNAASPAAKAIGSQFY